MSKNNLDLTGQKIYLLTPIRKYKKENSRHIYWECLCDCGNLKIIRLDNLLNGSTKSCGCLRKKTLLDATQIEEVCKLYIDGLSSGDLAKLFNCSERPILRILKIFNIPVRDHSHARQKYPINETIFDSIDTEEKAYWLGFLYADGCVFGNHVSLGLAESDADHVKRFSNFISGCDRTKIFIYDTSKEQHKNRQNRVYISVSNKHMANALTKIGCIPNKTLVLQFPSWLPNNLLSHFIRGYFDGDGSIGIYDNKIKSRKGGFTGSIYKKATFSILSTKEFLVSLQRIFGDLLQVNSLIYKRHKKRKNNNFTLSLGGNRQLQKLLDWIYNGATIYLPRKYNVYLELRGLNLSKDYHKAQ